MYRYIKSSVIDLIGCLQEEGGGKAPGAGDGRDCWGEGCLWGEEAGLVCCWGGGVAPCVCACVCMCICVCV